MKAIKLESNRLLFEPLGTKHLSENYLNWLNDKKINAYMESGGDYDIEKLKNYLILNEKKQILFWAILKKSEKKHIGNIKIDPINLEELSGEYGILIGEKSVWNKGYGFEASKTIINYCFKNLKLKKINLGVIKNNIRALELYRKLGFVEYKIIDNYKSKNGFNGVYIRMSLKNEK